MAAADDYPAMWLASRGHGMGDLHAMRDQCRNALAEIDRLRGAVKFHSDILDDVLPRVTLTSPKSVMKIDDRWMLVFIEPEEPT